ncbi:single-stranded DNA-binding protein [Rhodanobacter sp. FW106-PBR-R2A-1-13]|uniref:single-stranded DNA-binding protein n=1 Tax=Rhodanobacter sp. FW106-PBR-R2A-1-13 TaxID=3454845 RepID=UPI0034E3D2BF
MDINSHTIQGRLAADPRVIRNDRGAIARLRVVTNYRYQDRDNNWQKRDVGHNVIVRGDLVALVEDLRTGDGVFVIGFAEDHEYTDAQGVNRVERQLIAKTLGRPLTAAPAARRTGTATAPASDKAKVAAAPASTPPASAKPQPPAPPATPAPHEGDAFAEMDQLIERGAP